MKRIEKFYQGEDIDELLKNLRELTALLDSFGVTDYVLFDGSLARGLDYYTDTVFEISSENLGSQDAICGGGRYDLLAEQFGGDKTAGTGFASGIERLLMVLEAQNKFEDTSLPLDIYLCTMGEKASHISMIWLTKFRALGFRVDRDFLNRSVKAQMRDAHRQKARIVLLIGDNEIENKSFSVKEMESGQQSNIGFNDIEKYLKNYFNM